MDLKPLLNRCQGAGTTTALLSLLGQRHPNAILLVSTEIRARQIQAMDRAIPRTRVISIATAMQRGAEMQPGELLCDTDALGWLQDEIDRLHRQVAATTDLQHQVADLTAWQVAARRMAMIKVEEVADLSATIGRLQSENSLLAMKANNLEADLDDLRNIRTNMKLLEQELASAQQEAIEAQRLQRAAGKAPAWINTAERLPDQYELVLIPHDETHATAMQVAGEWFLNWDDPGKEDNCWQRHPIPTPAQWLSLDDLPKYAGADDGE